MRETRGLAPEGRRRQGIRYVWPITNASWPTRTVMQSSYLASFQFSPIPTSTSSGTFSVTARSMSSRTGRRRFLAGFFRRLEEQFVMNGQDHTGASAGHWAERSVDVDHRALEDTC